MSGRRRRERSVGFRRAVLSPPVHDTETFLCGIALNIARHVLNLADSERLTFLQMNPGVYGFLRSLT